MAAEHQLVSNPVLPVTCHAWSPDGNQLALSPNTAEVLIYKFDGKSFTKIHTLSEHSQTVTSVDWSKDNRLVTCAQDRNAYVWNLTKEGGVERWKPSLVILRINRAATCVKWSHDGKKFAVGSGARIVSVCYYEEDNDWWVSKHIKKPIRSTILSLSWHPNNNLLACGGCDFKARIFVAAIKEVDKKKPTPTCWGDATKFGDAVGEFSANGWVHDVAFSDDGNLLAFVSHDACVYVVDGSQGAAVVRQKTSHLPMRTLQWVRPAVFVAGGHDYSPILFKYTGGAIQEIGDADSKPEKSAGAGKVSAMDKFRNMDSKGTDDTSELQTALQTTHQNAINHLTIVKGKVGDVSVFSSAGKDGKIVLWDMATIAKLPNISL